MVPQLRIRSVAAGIDLFSFQRPHEALAFAVLPGTTGPARTETGSATLQPLDVSTADILRAAIGVMHQPRLRLSAGERHLQSGQGQARVQIAPQVPADDLARIGVE